MSETNTEAEFVCCNVFRPCYGPTCKFHAQAQYPATPPTPDLAAVREETWSRELRQIADAVDLMIFAFNKGDSRREAVQEMANRIRALAAVSRPAEARGEPVAWGWIDHARPEVNFRILHHDRAYVVDLWRRTFARTGETEPTLTALYAHPAPSGGEAAPRPETGEVSEAMVEAHISARRCENAVKPNGFENGSHADLYCPDCVRLRLTAALAAREGA